MIDRDFKSWRQEELSECLTSCKQKKYNFCISNPCFEIWILLHLTCIESENEEEKRKIKENKKTGSRTYCESKIIEKINSYNKSNPNFELILNETEVAINRAKLLTKNNPVNLFNEIGTDIYLLVEKLINAEKM